MNYFDLYSSYSDRTIAAAWDSQIKEPNTTPWLADTLTECGDELFERFAACYAELRALPRSARRALQRQLARSSELAAILPEYLQHGGRRLQHRMAWSLAGAALLLALGQGVATAATITVATNDPRIIPDGQCSLVEAIVNANNDAATHADCPAGSGADTIVLPANANVMLSNPYVTLYTTPIGTTVSSTPTGLPRITSPMTIEGNGATIARQGNAPAFGLVDVRGGFDRLGSRVNPGDLLLKNVTLRGGSSFGGLSNSGNTSIENSTVSNNTGGSGISNFGGFSCSSAGCFPIGGTLSIKNSTISGNTGRGVSNVYGTLTIKNSTVSGNTANFRGGGVYNYGTLTIENSTISGNTANVGGGGGVYNYGGTLAISNSTISDNRAGRGGGISNALGFYSVAGTLTLNNSLIAGNKAGAAPEIENDARGIVTANNFNLFGSNGNAGVTGFTPGPTDVVPSVSVARILRPLKFNGGPTQTHALVHSSPALDAGNPGGCRTSSGALLHTDQRGSPRHLDGNGDGPAQCDIGAVEGVGGAATPLIDFDGDGRSDIALNRNGTWFLRLSNGPQTVLNWGGASNDVLVPGDYDGDGNTDLAVFQAGAWYILRSSDGGQTMLNWGGAANDIPIPSDYDGDGKTDLAVFQGGSWYILRSSDGGQTALGWGLPDDKPVPADYDGDGKADITVYRDGLWFIIRSSDGGQMVMKLGTGNDTLVAGDYDGDGKADLAVFQGGLWSILRSSDGQPMTFIWGFPADIPVPGDYDGDGKTDLVVYRNGLWIVFRSSDGMQTVVAWGGDPEDIPLK
jgi:hypothetical protein